MNTRFLHLAVILLITDCLYGQSLHKPRISKSESFGVFNNVKVNFTVTVEETLLPNDTTPAASIISTSYIAANAQPDRPVIFIFNGGPGSSSSLLHMGSFGPKRLVFDGKREQSILIDNAYSVLDQSDLVFIDPVGTGYTKLIDSTKAEKYWDVFEDARAFTKLIKAWQKKYHRENAPSYICGESYGGARAVTMLYVAPEIKFKGVNLLSPMLDAGATEAVDGNDMPYLLFLPSLSAVAWFHHKLNDNIKSAEEAFTMARDFALSAYAPALMKGNQISESDKMMVARKLSAITGLSENFLIAHNLRVSEHDFILELLATDGKRIGRLDGQITGLLNAPKVRPPWDDPSMKSGPPARPSIDNYYKNVLKFPGTGDYTTLNLFANSKWTWYETKGLTAYWTVVPFLSEAVKANPALRVMVCGGYYDLATPAFAAAYAVEHSSVPAANLIQLRFAAGHSIFVLEENLKRLTENVRSMVSVGK